MKILIVEDDDSLADMLMGGLGEEGFHIDRAADGKSGLATALENNYDCLLLDIMIPGINGIELCRRLREKNRHVPIIMLTVRNEVADRVEGLNAGADDYLTKPFSYEELLARIQAQIRRNGLFSSNITNHGNLSLDAATLRANRAGVEVELTPKEFQLLGYFVQNAGRILTERELMENVWKLTFDPHTNVINVYLHRLREKLHVEGRKSIIETIRGQGYRLGNGS